MITPPAIISDHVQSIVSASQRRFAVTANDLARKDVSDAYKVPELRSYLEEIIGKNEQQGVTTGVWVYDLQTRQAILEHNFDNQQFAASINKIPIAQLIQEDARNGKVKLDDKITWSTNDVRPGAGTYDQPGAPLEASVKDLLYDMLNRSGNTAVRALVNYPLHGAENVNKKIANELGLQHTNLQPLTPFSFYLGYTTAKDAAKSLRGLLAPADSSFVKTALATNIYTDFGVRSQLAGNNYIMLANKVGILDDASGNNRHDVGIIYNTKTYKSYAYSFMTTASGQAATGQADGSLKDMGKGMLRYAGDEPPAGGMGGAKSFESMLAEPTPLPNKPAGKLLY